jgi:hypothetical protein
MALYRVGYAAGLKEGGKVAAESFLAVLKATKEERAKIHRECGGRHRRKRTRSQLAAAEVRHPAAPDRRPGHWRADYVALR